MYFLKWAQKNRKKNSKLSTVANIASVCYNNNTMVETNIKQAASEAGAAMGRIGGRATVKKHGKLYMRALAKKGGLAKSARYKKEVK